VSVMKGNLPDAVLSAAARNSALLVPSRRLFSVQDVDDLLAANDFSFAAAEDRQQANMLLLAADFIPRDPQTIGRSEVRSAELIGQVVGWEDKLLVRHAFRVFAAGVVKAVNDQLAVDFNWLVILVVEISPSGETADRWFAGLSVLGLGPGDEHLNRLIGFFLFLEAKVPGRVLVFVVLLNFFVGLLQRMPLRRLLGRSRLPGKRPAGTDSFASWKTGRGHE